MVGAIVVGGGVAVCVLSWITVHIQEPSDE